VRRSRRSRLVMRLSIAIVIVAHPPPDGVPSATTPRSGAASVGDGWLPFNRRGAFRHSRPDIARVDLGEPPGAGSRPRAPRPSGREESTQLRADERMLDEECVVAVLGGDAVRLVAVQIARHGGGDALLVHGG